MDINVYLEKVTKLPTPHKLGIIGGVVILILVGYYFFFYIAKTNELKSYDGKYQKLQSELTEKKAIADNLSKFQEEVNKLENKLKEALSKLPNSSEMDQLLVDIPNLGKESSLEIESFKPEKEVTKGFYAEVPISIELSGGFFDVAMFFYKLSNLSRIVNIKDITMKPGTKASGGKSKGGKGSGEEEEQDFQKVKLKVKGIATTYRFIEQKSENPDQKK